MHSLRCRVFERNSKKDSVTIFFTNSTTVGLKVGLTDLRSPWNQNFAQISIFTRFPIFPVFPWCFPPLSQMSWILAMPRGNASGRFAGRRAQTAEVLGGAGNGGARSPSFRWGKTMMQKPVGKNPWSFYVFFLQFRDRTSVNRRWKKHTESFSNEKDGEHSFWQQKASKKQNYSKQQETIEGYFLDSHQFEAPEHLSMSFHARFPLMST